MMPVGRNLVLQSTPKSGVMAAIATITWPALTAPVVGPFVGGWITTHFGWQWNFYVNVPLCLAAAVLFLALVPRQPRPEPRAVRLARLPARLRRDGARRRRARGLRRRGMPPPAPGCSQRASRLGWLAVRHLRRARVPLFGLDVLAVRVLRPRDPRRRHASGASRSTPRPSCCRSCLQVGFGLSAVETGSLVLVYFLGNLAMKSVTTPLMRRFGFRRVLIVNGALLAATIGAFAVIPADLARAPLLALLFAAGATRSLQFTALNTLAFADIGPAERSAATTLSSMFQQAAMVLGVALAVAAVRFAQLMNGGGGDPVVADLRPAFAAMALMAAASAVRFLGLRSRGRRRGRRTRPLGHRRAGMSSDRHRRLARLGRRDYADGTGACSGVRGCFRADDAGQVRPEGAHPPGGARCRRMGAFERDRRAERDLEEVPRTRSSASCAAPAS